MQTAEYSYYNIGVENLFKLFYDFIVGVRHYLVNPPEFLYSIYQMISFLVSILTILFIAGIVYTLIRIREIRIEEAERLHPKVKEEAPKDFRHEKWEVVLDHLNSNNEAEWRLSIIEADNILDELVQRLGYPGENLGERLKSASAQEMVSLQNAWEAHKFRNQIVHEGSDVHLTYPEAKRIVGLFEVVFREFNFI